MANKFIKVICLYFVGLLATWACIEWVFHSSLVPQSNTEQYWLVQNGIKEGLLKIVIWLVPALLLAHKYCAELYVPVRQMFTQHVRWLKLLPVFAFFTLYAAIGVIIARGSVELSPDLMPSQLLFILFVGITEEVVFRGWLLNATIKHASRQRMWLAVVINSVLFVLIHIPFWVFSGQLGATVAQLGFVAVFLLSVIFGWVFIKTKSIVPSIVLHMYWDMLIMLFYGA